MDWKWLKETLKDWSNNGLPISTMGGGSITLPPINVQVEATKSIADFILVNYEDTGTYMYLSKTNGNTEKCIIIRIHSDLGQTGYASGALEDLTTLWDNRAILTYTNNIVL